MKKSLPGRWAKSAWKKPVRQNGLQLIQDGKLHAENVAAILHQAGVATGPPAPPVSRYAQYLASPEWRIQRLNIFMQRGSACERCRATRNLQVHHKTYERLGKELPEDLELLCRDCHEQHHGKKQVRVVRSQRRSGRRMIDSTAAASGIHRSAQAGHPAGLNGKSQH